MTYLDAISFAAAVYAVACVAIFIRLAVEVYTSRESSTRQPPSRVSSTARRRCTRGSRRAADRLWHDFDTTERNT